MENNTRSVSGRTVALKLTNRQLNKSPYAIAWKISLMMQPFPI